MLTGLSLKPPVATVRGWYEQSFKDILREREPQTAEDEQALVERLHIILDRHQEVGTS